MESPLYKNFPRIICAALKNIHGDIICGVRHYDQHMCEIIDMLSTEDTDEWQTHTVQQGFIDAAGNFLTREQAYWAAYTNNQIIRQVGGDYHKLFSENLY